MSKKDNQINSQNSQKSLVIADKRFLYVHKKAEKVTAALYLVTSLMSDQEPLKWSLRKKGVTLLGELLPFMRSRSLEHIYEHIAPTLTEMISLLEVGVLAKVISEMNATVLQSGCEELLAIVHEDHVASAHLHPAFFDIAEMSQTAAPTPRRTSGAQTPNIRHSKPLASVRKMMTGDTNTTNMSASNRQQQILSIFKQKNRKLNVADITRKIKGVSDKTIQRDLQALVTKGLLNKSGSRRWTVYELKK